MRPNARIGDEKAKDLPTNPMTIVVMEGVLEYFSRDQVKICLNMLCDSNETFYGNI